MIRESDRLVVRPRDRELERKERANGTVEVGLDARVEVGLMGWRSECGETSAELVTVAGECAKVSDER